MKFIINNLIQTPRWKAIPCKCVKSNIEMSYPISECLHCKFTECESSVPTKSFVIQEPILDKQGKLTGATKDKTVNEITLVIGPKYQDVIGWSF